MLIAALISAAGAAHAQLQARDIDGNGTTDAYYDTLQNITWLADANYIATSGYATGASFPTDPGSITWSGAVSWADGLSAYGVSDWRLPVSFVPDLSNCGPNYGTYPCNFGGYESELSRLYTQVVASGSPFINIASGPYFTGNLYQLVPSDQPRFQYVMFNSGYRGSSDETGAWPGGYAWAVRDGDTVTTPVPEPSTYALMLAGLAMVGVMARRKRRG